ncbi:MAG TPA: ABC transporter ATP-binding protein [Methylomirabilota bacterium]|nr:ABC transporter ATP-binding protein [Methylomirabilota bacterium]
MIDGDGTPRLQALGLRHAFHRRRAARPLPVLDGITLAVDAAEFVAVVGPSGCGKTTLLHVLDGLVAPAEGRVLMDGRPVSAPGPDRAIVFQDPALLPWRTTLGNIAYGLECLQVPRREARAVARTWLEAVGLGGFADTYPHELSGGMQQRVNLARALAVDPAILLMDEPFAALDAQTREAMQADLLRLWARARKTVVFVTHLISEALYLADRVVVLTERPARVQATLAIDLPRPRHDAVRLLPRFRECEAHVRALLAAGRSAPDAAGAPPRPAERILVEPRA